MFSGASDKQATIDEGAPSDLHGADDENANAADESESLSDIDDVEVCKLVSFSAFNRFRSVHVNSISCFFLPCN